MADTKSVKRHRARQHQHALERLQERYWPDATLDEVRLIRDKAKAIHRDFKGIPFSDVKEVRVEHRGCIVRVLYCPRHKAVRTVLPMFGQVGHGNPHNP